LPGEEAAKANIHLPQDGAPLPLRQLLVYPGPLGGDCRVPGGYLSLARLLQYSFSGGH